MAKPAELRHVVHVVFGLLVSCGAGCLQKLPMCREHAGSYFSVVTLSPRCRLMLCVVAAPQCQDSTRILSAARPCSHGFHHAEESLHHCCWREARRKTQWHPRRQRQHPEESDEGSTCCKPRPLVANLSCPKSRSMACAHVGLQLRGTDGRRPALYSLRDPSGIRMRSWREVVANRGSRKPRPV